MTKQDPNPQPSPQTIDPNLQPVPMNVAPESIKTLLDWEAPERPFKKREREFYTTVGSIIFLVCVILLFIKEFLLIMVLIALAFFVYVLSTVKPQPTKHVITNFGIETMGKKFSWDVLGTFWFDQKWDDEILYIENYMGFPTRLMLLLGDQKKETIQKILEQYLIHERPEKTQIERAGEWLQKKVPLETEPTKPKTQSSKSSPKDTPPPQK